MSETDTGSGPLAGLKVLDIATIIAGPMAGSLLADFGAEVVKLELPGLGDGLRGFPPFKDGKPLWWKVTNRGKRHGTLDLRKPEGVRLFLDLVAQSDVLIENFRPGTLDRWGLDIAPLWAANPKLVVLRVSGFGQTGPMATQPGFARIFEAMGGLTHITGDPDRPPVHTGYPLADSVGGLFGAFAICAALLKVARSDRDEGEEIDLALTEAMFRVLESLAIEYDQLGAVRERVGNKNTYSAPSDVYMTADKRYVYDRRQALCLARRLDQSHVPIQRDRDRPTGPAGRSPFRRQQGADRQQGRAGPPLRRLDRGAYAAGGARRLPRSQRHHRADLWRGPDLRGYAVHPSRRHRAGAGRGFRRGADARAGAEVPQRAGTYPLGRKGAGSRQRLHLQDPPRIERPRDR